MSFKIAIAGAGHIANVHAQAVKNQGGQVVAVIEKFLDKATAFTQKFAIAHQYSTIEEALAEAKFDALVIGTPNFLHAPQTIAALKAGVPVMVEKPMALNAIESAEVIEASLRSQTVLVVAHCWRFDEEVRWLRSQADQLGKIIRTKSYGVHTYWGPGGWFIDKQMAGGGAIADVGIHAIDTARFLLGDPQPVSVFAKIGTYYQNFDVDDTGVIIINWDNGATSYIESGWWQPYVDSPLAGTQIYGTKGFGQIFPTRLLLPNTQKANSGARDLLNRLLSKLKQQKGLTEVKSGFKFPRKDHFPQAMYDRQMAHFFDCIKTKRTPISGGLEGSINMQIVDAAYASAKTGQVVEITGIT
ncbi:Gfo/Idh/MocA family protein [Pseudanabaena sp. ABRG5-3]|uniref:Gfo/Idh/MocA family protein n=1 Tax=Pseudanabaena sp. ABRG5-3 TaxID=685565 RepID=UPI000DC70D24|nr:Gfo/Idh/MocA family oxidoreductase [Pseudanabaena sp. ABRG5-3]BBC24294.1 oxidoreductase family, NAD-binding Rossmann fold protein [Pseudanabaena sp. ABRG5-3]